MTNYKYIPRGVCSREINFSIEDGKIHDLRFTGGCDGNLKAIGKLLEGKDMKETADILRGNDCRGRGTSCADQFARALDEIMAKEQDK